MPTATKSRIDCTLEIRFGETDARRYARQAANRKKISRDFSATYNDAGLPKPAKYLGTRRKDGWLFMEVRTNGNSQIRLYVNPKYITWKGEPPKVKWGDKKADFL